MEHDAEAEAAKEAWKAKKSKATKRPRTKVKAKRKLVVDEEEAPATKWITPVIISPKIVTPSINIHGQPIVPKEEQIHLDNIELPKFLLENETEKKRSSKRKVSSKSVKVTHVPHIVKKHEDKDVVIFDIEE